MDDVKRVCVHMEERERERTNERWAEKMKRENKRKGCESTDLVMERTQSIQTKSKDEICHALPFEPISSFHLTHKKKNTT